MARLGTARVPVTGDHAPDADATTVPRPSAVCPAWVRPRDHDLVVGVLDLAVPGRVAGATRPGPPALPTVGLGGPPGAAWVAFAKRVLATGGGRRGVFLPVRTSYSSKIRMVCP